MDAGESHGIKRVVRKRRSSIANAPDVRKEVTNGVLIQQRGTHSLDNGKNPLNKMLPVLNENDPGVKHLFLSKIQQCNTKLYNLYNELQMSVKQKTLTELYKFVEKYPNIFNKETSKAIASLVKTNCFRTTVRPLCDTEYFSPEDDVEYSDPFWQHKQIVYDIFFKLIISDQFVPLVPEVLNQTFIVVLIDQLGSECAEERSMVKSIIHRMYARFINLRSFLRTEFISFLSNFIATNSRGFGVAEILDIYSSIVSGFNVPIKPEHIGILTKVLIPLHNVDSLEEFNVQLTMCLRKYIQKNEDLANLILVSLLKIWPRMNSYKAVLYLKELENLLEFIPYTIVKDLYPYIMKWVSCCIKSDQFKISEKALQLLANKTIISNILTDKDLNLNDIIPALIWNKNNHWNAGIRLLNDQILSIYEVNCFELILKCSCEYDFAEAEASLSSLEKSKKEKIEAFWNCIISKISLKNDKPDPEHKKLINIFNTNIEDIY